MRKLRFGKGFRGGFKVALRPFFFGFPYFKHGRDRLAIPVLLLVHTTVSSHGKLERFGKGVDHRYADTMETTGYFVAIVVEFSACMEGRHDDLRCANVFFRVNVHRYASSVVPHRNGFFRMNVDMHFITMSCQRLVDGVIYQLLHHVMQACPILSITNVHARSFAYCIQASQDRNTS